MVVRKLCLEKLEYSGGWLLAVERQREKGIQHLYCPFFQDLNRYGDWCSPIWYGIYENVGSKGELRYGVIEEDA